MTDTSSSADAAPQHAPGGTSHAPSRFRSTLIQVLIVQAVALTLLGLLQVFYKL